MKYLWIALLALAAAPALAQNTYPPIPEIKYESNTDFLKLPFAMNFGEPVSVSVDGKSGDIYVANRSGISGPAYAPMANQILVFDKTGKYRHELAPAINSKSYVHAVRVDTQGYVWVVDKGSDMIVKFNPQGRVMMVFGRKARTWREGAESLEKLLKNGRAMARFKATEADAKIVL